MSLSLNQQMDNNDKWIKGLLVALVLALIWLCTSCSCEYHARKIKKKCATTMDTITLHDTVITKELHTDTVFKYYQRDTVVVREGKLVMKYFYNSHDSTVYLQGKSISDTVVKIIKAPYEKTVVKIDYFPKWLMWLLIALGLAGLIFKLLK